MFSSERRIGYLTVELQVDPKARLRHSLSCDAYVTVIRNFQTRKARRPNLQYIATITKYRNDHNNNNSSHSYMVAFHNNCNSMDHIAAEAEAP